MVNYIVQEPTANVAIAHDNDWIALLEEVCYEPHFMISSYLCVSQNLLQPEELGQEGRLATLVSQKYDVISEEGGYIYAILLSSLIPVPIQVRYMYKVEGTLYSSLWHNMTCLTLPETVNQARSIPMMWMQPQRNENLTPRTRAQWLLTQCRSENHFSFLPVGAACDPHRSLTYPTRENKEWLTLQSPCL